MKVSIVTISYNQAAFLEQTIRSVIEQDYPDIEYIMVDPGSMDGSREIIEKYRSKITHIIFEPDQGPADGLNKGFQLVTGDILGYVNSDDYYLPYTFTKIVDYFKNHPEIDVVSGNAHVIDANNRFLRYLFCDRFSLLGCAYGFSNLVQPSSFFRAKAFDKTHGFNIENHANWDGELFVDMGLNHAKFGQIDEYLSAFRISETTITGSAKFDKEKKVYSDRKFNKIMGRKKILADKYYGLIFRFYRYFTNPRDLFQRIIFGPIYARYSYHLKVKE